MKHKWLICSGLVLVLGAIVGNSLMYHLGFSGRVWLCLNIVSSMFLFYFAGYKDAKEERR